MSTDGGLPAGSHTLCRAEIEIVFNTALADAIEGKQLAQISTDCRTAIETELCQLLHEVLGDEICVNF